MATSPRRAGPAHTRRGIVPPAAARRAGARISSEGQIARPGLVRRLLEGLRPLTVVVAPAGYGKTALLAEWAASEHRRFAWIEATRHEAEPRALREAIGDALRKIGVDRARPRGDRPFVLVLDDAHLIGTAALRETVSSCLGWLPEGSTLALATRAEPDIGLGGLRARRMVTELRAGDLAMSPGEAAALLRLTGADPDFATVQALIAKTEGWPAALYLAALSLAEQPGEQFSGADELISAFLYDELLAELSAEQTAFLTRVSVLERVSGPLCDAVLEREGSAKTLAALCRSPLPIDAVDRSHEWYRMHGLLREALMTELGRGEPRLARTLHRRASAWHEQHGEHGRAIAHAVAGGDPRRAGVLMWADLLRSLGEGRASLERHLSALGDATVTGRADLAMVRAHAHLCAGRIDLALHWSHTAHAARAGRSKARRAGDPRDEELAAAGAIIEAWAGTGGPAGMASNARRAAELLDSHSGWRASSCLLGGVAALLVGDRGAARRLFDEGVERGAVTAPPTAALCLAQSAALELEAQQWEDASDLAARALALSERQRAGEEPGQALVHAVCAIVAEREGRIDEAKSHVRRSAAGLERLAEFTPWYLAQLRILLARALTTLGDIPEARSLLAGASRLARRTPGATLPARWLDEAWGEIDTHAESALSGTASLTTAELRILRFLPTHYSFREIAARLHVSSNTVKTQVHAVYRKLGASTRSEAVATASRAGLLEL